MSGACAKCCSFACRRGRSQWGYEHAGWEEAARGGGLSRRRAVAWPASRASPGLREPLGEPAVFTRSAEVHDPLYSKEDNQLKSCLYRPFGGVLSKKIP